MEKICSGQPYLYRKNGFSSTVIDVRMKDKVRGDYLNRALQNTVSRFPYMTVKLVEKDGCYYFAENHVSMNAVKTDNLRPLGSMISGYHLLDVTFFDNKIKVAFHHGLCDGKGIKPFVETLLYYYCTLKYHKNFDVEGIRLEGEPLLPGETDEPFGEEFYEVKPENIPEISNDGYALPECAEDMESNYRTEISINQEEYVRYAKANNATPAILTAILASKGIKKLHQDADKPIICSMATDYRFAIESGNTHKDCTGTCYLPYTKEYEEMPINELATQYRELLSIQKNPDAVKNALNMQIGLFNKLDRIKTLEEKKEALAFFNDMCVNTYVISYLGILNIGEYQQYVEAANLYGSDTRGITFSMIACGDTITVNIWQSFAEDKYAKAFMAELDNIGISYKNTEIFSYKTAEDKSYITASRQSERYMYISAN